MERSITAAAIALCTLLAPLTASAEQYRDLCSSVPGACEHTGPNAPVLDADVCWSEGGVLTLKGQAPCPSDAWPYHLGHGELLDPLSQEIAAYSPLDWACDHPGLCVSGPVPPEATAQSLCCEWGVCVPLVEAVCNSPASVAVMCFNGVSNEDGSVTCYDGEPFSG